VTSQEGYDQDNFDPQVFNNSQQLSSSFPASSTIQSSSVSSSSPHQHQHNSSLRTPQPQPHTLANPQGGFGLASNGLESLEALNALSLGPVSHSQEDVQKYVDMTRKVMQIVLKQHERLNIIEQKLNL